MMKGCKSDGEGTFSGTGGNDGDAPIVLKNVGVAVV
jgi:hypothetical protein